MNPLLKQLLENMEFHESQDKPGLWEKKLDQLGDIDAKGNVGITAYIDFRRAAEKGRRFYTVDGVDGIFDNEDDVNSIPVLLYFKTKRDEILGANLPEKPKTKKELVIGNVEAAAAKYGIPKEMANLFFMTFDGGLYIKNPGLLYLAGKIGYSRIEITDICKDGEWQAECKIYPRLTKELLEGVGQLDKALQKQALDFITAPTNGTGRANTENVKMKTMHSFLKEMAQTRACNRALRNYTGYGGTSYEELPEAQLEAKE